MDDSEISIILPCYNEAENLEHLLPKLRAIYPATEIIVVDDGSTDNSGKIAVSHGARVIRHPMTMGNGASIKTGARHATGEILVFMDADGQHNPDDIAKMLEKLNDGYDMVVGARSFSSHASLGRRITNTIYNKLASLLTGFHIKDLTSGFRVVRASQFRKFLYLLPNGFSYPTTSTMAFFRSAFPVGYIPINAAKRKGGSKIRLLKDGTRFFIIIIKVGALFSPMRFFLPISGVIFLTGCTYYGFTYYLYGRFTNMSALLFIASLMIFLIGIISEQISSLHYRGVEHD